MKSNIGNREVGKPRRWISLAWRVIRPVLIAYLLVLLAMTFVETRLVYPIPSVSAHDWHPVGLDFEEVWFCADDGTKLFGWFAPQPTSTRAILYCHGNGEDVSGNAGWLRELRQELNASVFIFDYRGYGYSEGRPDEAGCIADGLAADKWLANRLGIKTTDVIVMGRSLGGGVAAAIASQQGAQAVVLVNTFSRLVDVAAIRYPWLPVRLLMRNRYDSIARIRQYDGPVFQAHGTDDGIVPIEFARELFAAAPSTNKAFLEIPRGGHNCVIPGAYYRKLTSFLDQVTTETSPPQDKLGK